MKKFLKIYWKSISFSVAQATIFRASFFIFYFWLLSETTIRILFFGAIFGQVKSIGGWSFQDTFFLVMLSGMMWDFVWCFYLTGFEQFMEHFSQGGFDFVLLKPMNPLTYITVTGFSARSFSTARFPLLIYGLIAFHYHWQLSTVIGSIVSFLAGIVILHALYAMVAACSFWIIDTEPIEDLSYNLADGSRYPASTFPRIFKFIFTFIFPIIFVTNVPVMIIMKIANPFTSVLAIGIAIIFEFLAYAFWSFSIKHYSSASS